MGKVKGKRIRRNFVKKPTNDISTEVVNHLPVVNSNETATLETGELSGYIFMCNGNTKPECYVNRVFGLPAGRREVVEKIKPGTKLFLFDFDVKLLYGVYEAVSTGGMNLQPTAFGGRFPAQVQFKIWKDCLPLPLNSFRSAIKDNFQGSKFAQELNDQQVRDLLLLFKPIIAPSPAPLHLPVPDGAYGPRVQPPIPSATPMSRTPAAVNGWLNPSSSNPPLQNRYQTYMARPLHNHSPQTSEPEFIYKDGLNPYPYHHHLSVTHQAARAHVNLHRFVENQPPYFSNEHPENLQEAYPRHLTIPAVSPRDPTVGLNGGYNGLAIPTVTNHIDRSHSHNPYTAPTSLYGSTPAPYSGPAYMHSQPPMRVSSYYSFVGGTQIER
ncbi:putative development/cell death domain-containing protein [Helianthus annuus]|nr:putative development/cell death domain-containing protein [Helianthus annuus]